MTEPNGVESECILPADESIPEMALGAHIPSNGGITLLRMAKTI
jgi:hypothetical protein